MNSQYQACIEACSNCAIVCQTCATACLHEDNVKMMARCIALDMDCADICAMATAAMARNSEFAKEICKLCATICRACGEECGKHEHDHCQECAKACMACAEACEKMAA